MFKLKKENSNKIIKYTKVLFFATTLSMINLITVKAIDNNQIINEQIDEKSNQIFFISGLGLIALVGSVLLSKTIRIIKNDNNDYLTAKYKIDYDSVIPYKKLSLTDERSK